MPSRRPIADGTSFLLLTIPIARAIVVVMSTQNRRPPPPFREFWQSLPPAEKVALAARARTPVAYLSQIAHGWRGAGIGVIVRLLHADNRITMPMMLSPKNNEAA